MHCGELQELVEKNARRKLLKTCQDSACVSYSAFAFQKERKKQKFF